MTTTPDLLKVLASGIRRCRKAKGLTIEKAAERSGVDAGFLAHIEVSRKRPSLQVIAKLARGLDIAPEELFWAGEPKGDALSRRVEAVLRRLPRQDQADVLAILLKLRRRADIRALKTLLKA
jgi:transcriptional regulator with XRE-family HTH domain